MLPHLESSELDLAVIDTGHCPLDTGPWTLSVPTVRFDLTQFKTETTHPVTYQQSYLELISNYSSYHTFRFTDGLKTNDAVATTKTKGSRMPVVSLATALFTQLNFGLLFEF